MSSGGWASRGITELKWHLPHVSSQLVQACSRGGSYRPVKLSKGGQLPMSLRCPSLFLCHAWQCLMGQSQSRGQKQTHSVEKRTPPFLVEVAPSHTAKRWIYWNAKNKGHFCNRPQLKLSTVNGAPDCTGLDSGVINYYLPDLGHVPQSLCLIPSYKLHLFKNLPLGKREGLNKVLALKRTWHIVRVQ